MKRRPDGVFERPVAELAVVVSVFLPACYVIKADDEAAMNVVWLGIK